MVVKEYLLRQGMHELAGSVKFIVTINSKLHQNAAARTSESLIPLSGRKFPVMILALDGPNIP